MGESLKVVMATTSFPRWRGDFAGHFVAGLAAALSDRGHKVSVVAPHDAGAPEQETLDGVDVLRVRYASDGMERLAYGDGIVPNLKRDPRAWLGIPALASALRGGMASLATEADLFHLHWAPMALLAGRQVRELPVVLTVHGSDTTLGRKGGVWGRMLDGGLARATGVIAVAPEQADLVRERAPHLSSVTAIPSGVANELVERLRPQSDSASFDFLFVGRLIDQKGVGDAVDAFLSLPADLASRATLTVAGKGPMEGPLRERVTSRQMDGRIRFLGEVTHERALELMASADALLLPSYAEGSPLSVVEAMSLGTPVISTPVGAVADLLGSDGLLVEPGDIAALSAQMKRWIEDRAESERLGASARERMAASYTWPSLAERTEAFYREVLAQAKRDK